MAWARAYGLIPAPGSTPDAVPLIGPGFDPDYAMTTSLDDPVIIASITAAGSRPPAPLLPGSACPISCPGNRPAVVVLQRLDPAGLNSLTSLSLTGVTPTAMIPRLLQSGRPAGRLLRQSDALTGGVTGDGVGLVAVAGSGSVAPAGQGSPDVVGLDFEAGSAGAGAALGVAGEPDWPGYGVAPEFKAAGVAGQGDPSPDGAGPAVW
jgi:hypothetical protein